MLMFMAKTYTLKIYFPTPTQPSSEDVNTAVQKVYPGAKVLAYYPCITSSNSGYIVANEEKDHEVSMAQAQLDKAEKNIKVLKKKLGTKEKNIPAWVQAKITDTEHNTDAAAGYTKEELEIQENTTLDTPEKRRKNYLLNIGVIGESPAWTREEGKNKKGGLNEKGRKSYERENPGSDLKAPSKKVGNPRRASFCARMSGMKSKLTSKKTANDPNSRINKSLRSWNC